MEPALAGKLVHDASGADALPLLAFTLEKLFHEFGADGNLTAERYDAMGGIGGSIDRALSEAQRQAGSGGTAEHLRRLMVPGLATWDPAANAAKRLVANETGLLSGERASLTPLANALVANRLLSRGAGTLEVAHEALLRRQPIAGWLEAQKEALKRRDDVLREAAEWADPTHYTHGYSQMSNLLLVRRGERLHNALELAGNPDFAMSLAPARNYLAACRKVETAAKSKSRRTQAVIYTLMLGIIAGLVGFINEAYLKERYVWFTQVRGHVLTPELESQLKPGDPIKECAKFCPDMVVVPAGEFLMGSPADEKDRGEDEDDTADVGGKQVTIKIAKPFAVSKFEVTFDQWDACFASGGCKNPASDSTWGRGKRPVINVSWDDAQEYVVWLSKLTGQPYRLLSEAEWEYAARAGKPGRYGFGDNEAALREYAWFTENSDSKTHPAGEKKPNAFGLYDMHGNVWEWVQDCYQDSYKYTPTDGSTVASTDCIRRVLRGSSWDLFPDSLRSADRYWNATGLRNNYLGFRVGRTLTP